MVGGQNFRNTVKSYLQQSPQPSNTISSSLLNSAGNSLALTTLANRNQPVLAGSLNNQTQGGQFTTKSQPPQRKGGAQSALGAFSTGSHFTRNLIDDRNLPISTSQNFDAHKRHTPDLHRSTVYKSHFPQNYQNQHHHNDSQQSRPYIDHTNKQQPFYNS